MEDDLLNPLVERAIEYAAQWHDATYRKGTWRPPLSAPEAHEAPRTPAFAHLTAVAHIVQRAGWPDPAVAAAYLHDAVEDRNRHGQRLARRQLRDAMGTEVTTLVAWVSEQKLGAQGEPRAWKPRKDDYLQQIADAPDAAVAISLADKLHNLWTMNQSLDRGIDIFSDGPQRAGLSAGPGQQQWFYQQMLARTAARSDPRLVRQHERLQVEVDRFQGLLTAQHVE
ncbi:HD domain-containing protein [Salisaeta longa]|uniref:HD domain-containing protein n=1 Tax=Salisaeta longa TaxID=503170 RepID=UPI0003B356EB|nr:HD domain-containing protein [Salisaeta longa]